MGYSFCLSIWLSVTYTPPRLSPFNTAINGFNEYSNANKCAGLPPVMRGSTAFPLNAFLGNISINNFNTPVYDALYTGDEMTIPFAAAISFIMESIVGLLD